MVAHAVWWTGVTGQAIASLIMFLAMLAAVYLIVSKEDGRGEE